MQALRREISILRRVSADANIVQFYGAVLPEEGNSAANPAMLVMEYMEVGRQSLNQMLHVKSPVSSSKCEVDAVLHNYGLSSVLRTMPHKKVSTVSYSWPGPLPQQAQLAVCSAQHRKPAITIRTQPPPCCATGGDLRHALAADDEDMYQGQGLGRTAASC